MKTPRVKCVAAIALLSLAMAHAQSVSSFPDGAIPINTTELQAAIARKIFTIDLKPEKWTLAFEPNSRFRFAAGNGQESGKWTPDKSEICGRDFGGWCTRLADIASRARQGEMGGRPRRHAAGCVVVLVDSSVWIDFLRGKPTPQTNKLDALLAHEPLAISDLILAEVLQGFGSDRAFNEAQRLPSALELVVLGGSDIASEAARHFRRLRAKGVTVRKTVDTIIATRCIVGNLELLHSDRDVDPFEQYLGLRVVARAT